MKKMMPVMLIMLVLVVGAITYAVQGIKMHKQVVVEEAKFHQLQSEYFTLSKVERESALTGSELNQKLVQIQNYPSSLMELKLIGVGKILTGIFGLLFGILIVLFMMPIRLAKMMKPE